jgi:hypothetical protein
MPTRSADRGCRHEIMGGRITCHNSSSTDERMLPDRHATHHDSSLAHCGSPSNSGRPQLSARRALCARGDGVIGEDDTWTKKDVISDVKALEDHHLDLTVTWSPIEALFSTMAPSHTCSRVRFARRPGRGRMPNSGAAPEVVAFPQSIVGVRSHRPVATKSSRHLAAVFNRALRHCGAPRAPQDKAPRRAPQL